MQDNVIFVEKEFKKILKIKIIEMSVIIVIIAGKCRGAVHNICNLKFKMPNEISVVFHNGSCYHYHFIIKELANEFEWQFECLGKSKGQCKTFVPIKKGNYKN